MAGHVACERWGTFCTAESGTPRVLGPKNKLTILGGLEKYKEGVARKINLGPLHTPRQHTKATPRLSIQPQARLFAHSSSCGRRSTRLRGRIAITSPMTHSIGAVTGCVSESVVW